MKIIKLNNMIEPFIKLGFPVKILFDQRMTRQEIRNFLRMANAHGVKDKALILELMESMPNANLGIVTAGFPDYVKMEIKSKEGGLQTLRELKAKGFILPRTLGIVLADEGYKLFYRLLKCKKDLQAVIGRGITLTNLSFVERIPPSRLRSGKEQSWLNSVKLEKAEIADLPDFIRHLGKF